MHIARRLVDTIVPWCLVVAAAVALCTSLGCGGGGGGGSAAPATITGRVLLLGVGGGATPLASANVSTTGASTTTGPDGTFTLTNASSAATQITISATGAQTLTQPLPRLAANKSNSVGDIFLLNASDTTDSYKATIVSSVARADNLKPIPGATVLIAGQEATTDANGNFKIAGLPTGMDVSDGQVGVITAPGFADKPVVLDLPLGAGNNNLPPFVMVVAAGSNPPGSPTDIRGTASLGQTPTQGVSLALVDNATGQTVSNTTSAADGSFGFYVVAGSYTLTASYPGHNNVAKQVTLTRPDVPVTVNFSL